MLIGFTVRNFRSFHDSQTCSFLASNQLAHEKSGTRDPVVEMPRLTRTAIIFGPNASGKSNLLMALQMMRDLVVHSSTYSPGEFASKYSPFLLDESGSSPTTFQVDLLIGGSRYEYELSYDSRRICSEQLTVSQESKSQRWFKRRYDRLGQRERWSAFGQAFTGRRRVWQRATRESALFLTTAVRLNCQQLLPVSNWFESQLVIHVNTEIGDLAEFAALLQFESFKTRILEILRAVDLQVLDVRVVRSSTDSRAWRGAPENKGTGDAHDSVGIEFLHARPDNAPVWLDLKEQAMGIKRLVGLLGPFLTALDTGRLAAIDEFDTSLHPLVARFLIQLIHDPRISRQSAQLLLSSHTTSLMDYAELAPNDMWLMSLDQSRASCLSRMPLGAPGEARGLQGQYLDGDFGSVPRLEPGAAGAMHLEVD